MSVYRQLTENFPELEYSANVGDKMRCHMGQKKLYLSELEYFRLIMQDLGTKNLSNFLIVYIGAANGVHTNLFFDIFKEPLSYLLYDPNPFQIKPQNAKHCIIKTGDEGFFTDDKVKDVLELANGREIIYLCDIRKGTPTESTVWNNMIEQQRWGVTMNAKYMLLKLRFPYVEDESEFLNRNYDISDIENKLVKTAKNIDTTCDLPYLDGDIYFQIYAPKRSTEARLFVKRDSNGKYPFTIYNYKKYESQLNYYNAHTRITKVAYEKSGDIQKYIPGYTLKYDEVAEYAVIYDFYKYMSPGEDVHILTMRRIYENNVFMMANTINNNIYCAYKNLFDKGTPTDVYHSKFMKLSRHIVYLLDVLTYISSVNKQITDISTYEHFTEDELTTYYKGLERSSNRTFNLEKREFFLDTNNVTRSISELLITDTNAQKIVESILERVSKT